jgi:hypothetical protein
MRFAAIAVVLLAATACGATKPFAARAGGICATANARVVALGPEPRILTPTHADWLKALTGIDAEAIRNLRQLEPPAAQRARVESMLGQFDRGFAGAAAIVRASRAGREGAFREAVAGALDHITAAQLAAAGAGLAECARLGSVAR